MSEWVLLSCHQLQAISRREALIRLAEHRDCAQITRIIHAAYAPYVARIGRPPAPMTDDYLALIEKGAVWRQGAAAVTGVLVMYPLEESWRIETVAVDRAVQGQGHGGALLRFAEEEGRRRGYGQVTLYTNALMHENLSLYPALGYEVTGRREEDGFDRVFFRKALDAM